jgi:hypothetical protein
VPRQVLGPAALSALEVSAAIDWNDNPAAHGAVETVMADPDIVAVGQQIDVEAAGLFQVDAGLRRHRQLVDGATRSRPKKND